MVPCSSSTTTRLFINRGGVMGWLAIGMKVLPLIVDAVKWVERFFDSGKGKAKQDAAVAVVMHGLGIVEAAVDRDLLKDEDVENAARRVIDAVVAFQNVLANKAKDE
jgi:hypothetical protein